jgi:hypothetical protein
MFIFPKYIIIYFQFNFWNGKYIEFQQANFTLTLLLKQHVTLFRQSHQYEFYKNSR